MLVVNSSSSGPLFDREAIDKEARQIVLEAYRAARIMPADPQRQFNAALEIYLKNYPHISKEIARQAVAYIISTDGL